MLSSMRQRGKREGSLAVPGPRALPLIGSLGSTLRFLHDPVGYTGQLFERYGSIVALSANGNTNLYSPLPHCPGTIFVYKPELVSQITTQFEMYHKFPLTGTLYRRRERTDRTEPLKRFGVGLFGVNSDTYRQHHHLLMPAFHKKQIEAYHDDMVVITQEELDTWPVGCQFDLVQALRSLTMRIALKTLFGIERDEQKSEVAYLLQKALNLLVSPLIALLPFDLPGLPYHRLLSFIGYLDSLLRTIITEKQASNSDMNDVLSMLIRAYDEGRKKHFTEDEVLGHAGAIFGAGYETSANTLAWTIFLLAQHPQIAADLLDELDNVLHGDAPTVKQLQHLPLLDHVVKESLRVLPPIPLNARVLVQSTELGNYTLFPGTEIFISIYHTHHMGELYSRPHVFDPQRWEYITPSIFEYHPFSAGPRMCIGSSFAMMETKIILAMLVQRYRLQCVPGSRVDRSGLIVLTPKGPLSMVIYKQDKQFSQIGRITGNIHEMVSLPE